MLVLLSAFLLCATAESHARVSSLPTPRWVADDEKDVGDVTNRGERRGGKLIVVFTPVCLRRDSPPRARTLARSPARHRPASRFGWRGSSSIAFSTAGWPNAGSSGTSPRCCASLASRNRGCRRASALPGRDEKGLGVAAKPLSHRPNASGLQLFGGGPSELLMSR